MKKITWLVLTIMIIFVFSACGSGTNESGQPAEVSEINYKIAQPNKVETFPYYYADESQKLVEYYNKVISGENTEYYYVDLSKDNQYKRSLNNTDYLYYGELEDNYPNGIGVIFKKLDIFDGNVYIVHAMSDFEKGYINGYSLCYDIEIVQGKGIQIKFKDDYEGYYKKGKVNGDGIVYCPSVEEHAYIHDEIGELQIENGIILSDVPLSQTCVLYIGENDGVATGKGTIYSIISGMKVFVGEVKEGYRKDGCEYYDNQQLKYDGEFKNNDYHGEGKLYYENGQLKYEGKFKNGVYHGKGVLYDENGDVIHDGKFKNGEID